MARQVVNIGTTANDGTGSTIRDSFDIVNDNSSEIYSLLGDGTNLSISGDVTMSAGAVTIGNDKIDSQHYVDGSIDTAHIANDQITHDKIENRYTAQGAISTLTGTVSFDCSTATNFKLSGDLTGAYTIDLSNYKKGQIITIWPLKAQSITLDAQGSSTNTFYKIGNDYDNSTTNVLQIECVDDSSTDPVFFYSIATYTSDSTP